MTIGLPHDADFRSVTEHAPDLPERNDFPAERHRAGAPALAGRSRVYQSTLPKTPRGRT